MKRLYADDISGRDNVYRIPIEPRRRSKFTELEYRWDALRPSRQLGVLLLVVLMFAALFTALIDKGPK